MEKAPDPDQGQTTPSHPYSSLPQSKKRKNLPYTWLSFFFLVVLAIVATVIVKTVPIKKDLRTVTHRIQTPQQQKTSQSGQ